MNFVDKLRYLGPAQTARKCLLRFERAAASVYLRPPPTVACSTPIDLRLTLLGHEFDLSAPDRWHRSPDTGRSWPLAPSQGMGVTGPEPAGDVKLVWELNRHQFLPDLARKNPELVTIIIRDWIAQNPYKFGINWNSAMEVGLRLIAWCEVFESLPHLQEEFSASLAQHARFVRHHFSSDWIPRGNHLIGEATALAVYGREYAAFARRWLAQAAREQFHPSGVHREQSVAYHHFVTHLFARAGMPLPRSLEYLGAIRQPDGSLPMIGDSDDGRVSMKELDLPLAPATSVAFPDAGHYLIRNGGDYCLLRCGEFGLPPNYAHGHADLLSPLLWLRGKRIFVDAGTFTYNGDVQWRRYFRSAEAHNVVTVDDQDMAEQTDTFSWKHAPHGVCETWSGNEFIGSVGPWKRHIRYDGAFAIVDTVAGTGRHRLRWRFHLDPNLKARCSEAGRFQLGEHFSLTAPGTLQVREGWFSPSYGVRVPIDICEISLDAMLPVTAEFTLR